jgi:osmotically-inducible protein OsmY
MKIIKVLSYLILSSLLGACLSNVWTGANLVYGRHHVYKKSTDIKIAAMVGHALKIDPGLNCPSNKCFEIATFHGDILVLGTVPSQLEKDKVTQNIQKVGQYRHLYNYVKINPNYDYPPQWQDHWITTQIRSQILANSDIDPEPFKIVSHENEVYVMGDVMEEQESLIIDVCRKTQYVNKVYNLMQTYTLKKQPKTIAPVNSSPQLPSTQAW